MYREQLPKHKEPVVCLKSDVVTARHYQRSDTEPYQYFNGMTIQQRRLLALAVSKLDHQKFNYLEHTRTVTVSVQEFAEIFQTHRHSLYQEFKRTSAKLFATVLKKYHSHDKSEEWIHLFEHGHYLPMEGMTRLVFTTRGAQCFSSYMLENGFTQTRLMQLAKLKTGHAWTLYNILQQRRDTGIVNIETDELRHALGLDTHEYKNSAHFHQYVIETSLNEINKNTDLSASYTTQKRGRKISLYSFTFKKYAV